MEEKRYIAVRPELSVYLLPTQTANLISYGHSYVVQPFIQKFIAFKSMLWAQYVKVFIMRL